MRLILIDHSTGYVFGDSADFAGGRAMENEAEAARQLDESLGVQGRTYETMGAGYRPAANETAYHVYRADIRGSDAVAIVQDGQDPEMIADVERECDKLAVVLCHEAADAA